VIARAHLAHAAGAGFCRRRWSPRPPRFLRLARDRQRFHRHDAGELLGFGLASSPAPATASAGIGFRVASASAAARFNQRFPAARHCTTCCDLFGRGIGGGRRRSRYLSRFVIRHVRVGDQRQQRGARQASPPSPSAASASQTDRGAIVVLLVRQRLTDATAGDAAGPEGSKRGATRRRTSVTRGRQFRHVRTTFSASAGGRVPDERDGGIPRFRRSHRSAC